jgi:outer membrane protein TolC
MKLIFRNLPLTIGFVTTAFAGESPVSATAEFIARLAAEAQRSHPKIQAERARTEAALAGITAIRLWEDPDAIFGVTAASRAMQMDDGDVRVGVEQKLPRTGVYRAEVRRAAAESQAQDAMRRLSANELALSVAQAALELALADEVIGLQADDVRWLETIVGTALERVKDPNATAAEPLRLEGELALRSQRLEAARRERAQFERNLNILLGRNPNAHWPALVLPSEARVPKSVSALRAKLEADNPMLAGLRYKIDSATAEEDAFRERQKPTFAVGVESSIYSRDADVKETMLSMRVSLPWFNRAAYRADVARAERLKAAAQSDLAAQQRELFAKLTQLLTQAENSLRIVTAYSSDVLPKAGKALDVTRSAWVSSKATLLEVLDSRRALLEARQEQKRASAAFHVALHSLAALTSPGPNSATK